MHFDAVFHSAPVRIILLSADAEAIILAVNDEFLRHIRHSREDLLGRSVFAAFPGNPADRADTGIDALARSLARVAASGQRDTLSSQRYPIQVVRADGSMAYEERFWDVINTPVFDQKGQLVCISHTAVDVTARRQTEAALKKTEVQYRSLFNSIEEAFCVMQVLFDEQGQSADYRFCDVNPTFEAHTGLHDAIGKTVREVAPLLEASWFGQYAALAAVAKTGEPVRFECEAKALNRWFEGYAFRTDEPSAHMVALLFKDITRHKQEQQMLRRRRHRALAAAREAAVERRRLDAVLDAAPVGIYVTNASGEVLRANSAHRQLWTAGQDWLAKEAPQRVANAHRLWKGRWADGSARHGQRIAPSDWPLAAALRGAPSHNKVIEIDGCNPRSGSRTVIASGAPIRDDAGRTVGAVAAHMDITERVQAEASLRETASRLQFVLDSAQIGEWELDLIGNRSYRSLRHDQCFGYDKPVPEWTLADAMRHVHPDDRPQFIRSFEVAVANLSDWHIECRVIWPDGSEHWIAAHGSVYRAGGMPMRMAGIVLDVTQRKQAEEKVRHAALHDPLTGLSNRAMLFEYAARLLSHNRRTGRAAAVLFADLDRFKHINDMHGHDTGDAVLKEVAGRLASSVRGEDIVIRLGGDEFVILLQDIRDAHYAAEATRHIVEKINQPYRIGELTLSLSASVGISIFPDDAQDIGTLISHADAAMYQAKRAGRNDFQYYSSELAAGTRLQHGIEQQLKSALLHSAFHLCYQPVLDLESGDIVSVEALLRWPNADIGPDRFVPVAEASGIINPIGRWVLREAFAQHKAWVESGLPAIPISINISVVELRDRDFVGRFERLMDEYGIEKNVLQVEVTETAVMDDIDQAIVVLKRLRALGVTILLDDFGTGYSSLAYLARLPLDKIKIDKSFISNLDTEVASLAVTEAVLALGQSLNLDVVAEGIESTAVRDHLQSHGCQQGQGYLFSKPMTGVAFASWYWQCRHPSLASVARRRAAQRGSPCKDGPAA